MSQTDPIAELLTRIRNAMHARYNQVEVPHSRMREAICRTLSAEGFLGGIEVAGEIPKKKLVVGLRYSGEREPVIRGIERVKRPSLRRYAGAIRCRGCRMGWSAGGDDTARRDDRSRGRRKKVGGEVLLRIW